MNCNKKIKKNTDCGILYSFMQCAQFYLNTQPFHFQSLYITFSLNTWRETGSIKHSTHSMFKAQWVIADFVKRCAESYSHNNCLYETCPHTCCGSDSEMQTCFVVMWNHDLILPCFGWIRFTLSLKSRNAYNDSSIENQILYSTGTYKETWTLKLYINTEDVYCLDLRFAAIRAAVIWMNQHLLTN